MKLEVGMYVRTILGISKLIEVRKNRYVFDKLDKDLWSDVGKISPSELKQKKI